MLEMARRKISDSLKKDERKGKIMEMKEEKIKDNKWVKVYDGFFNYYANVATGEKKFKLEDSDILVDSHLDDFYRQTN